jgi:hypothetical protein
MLQPLKEFLLYTEAVKEALNRRDATQIEFELTVDELNKKRAEKEMVVYLKYISVLPRQYLVPEL